MVRSHCSATIKQPCLNKAKNGKDQREYINSENDFYNHFQACKLGAFRNFAKFSGKHLRQSHFFNKVAGQACNFIIK